MDIDVNAALTGLGRWGPWQRRAFVLISLSGNLVLSMNTLIIVFIGNTPSHHCIIPHNNISTSPEEANWVHEQCRLHTNSTNISTYCTDGWHYDINGRATIVSEWDLVCDKDYYVDLSQTVFMVALLLSDFFVTAVADYFGRKRAHILSAFLSGVSGITLAFSPDFTTFVIFRFISGLFVDGTFCTSLVYLVEHFAVHNRMVATCLNLFFWPCGIWLLDLLAYLIPHWRHLTLAVGILHMLPIVYFWLLDESLPWLEAKHKYGEFYDVIKCAAKMNQIPLDRLDLPTVSHTHGAKNTLLNCCNHTQSNDAYSNGNVTKEKSKLDENLLKEGDRSNNGQTFSDQLVKCELTNHGEKSNDVMGGVLNDHKDDASDSSPRDDNVLRVLRHPRLCLFTAILSLIWLTSNVSYYGVSLGAGNLAGSLYVNIFIFGSMDFMANIGIFISSKWFGRRPPIIIGFFMVGVCLIVKELIPNTKDNNSTLYPLFIAVIMVGYCGTAAAFADICIYTPELFPTRVRNLTYGITMAFGRIGGILAPIYSYASGSVSWVPAAVVGTAAILTGIATFALPETRKRPLFQTIKDMDEWEKRRKDKHIDGVI